MCMPLATTGQSDGQGFGHKPEQERLDHHQHHHDQHHPVGNHDHTFSSKRGEFINNVGSPLCLVICLVWYTRDRSVSCVACLCLIIITSINTQAYIPSSPSPFSAVPTRCHRWLDRLSLRSPGSNTRLYGLTAVDWSSRQAPDFYEFVGSILGTYIRTYTHINTYIRTHKYKNRYTHLYMALLCSDIAVREQGQQKEDGKDTLI